MALPFLACWYRIKSSWLEASWGGGRALIAYPGGDYPRGHVSASSQLLCFNLKLRLYSSFMISRPEVMSSKLFAEWSFSRCRLASKEF